MDIYHEKQSRMLCAVHCLNNLFQSELETAGLNNFLSIDFIFLAKGEFSKEKLDQICANLSPDQYINPHKSLLGLGNYDVNVLMAALETKSMLLSWFDKRKEITSENLELSRAFGFILNIPSDYTFAFVTLPIKSRHWICVKKMPDDKFYSLDSKFDKPKCVGGDEDFIRYLKDEMKSNDKELFMVFPMDS